MDILTQLYNIYEKEENWHTSRLPEQDFKGVKKYLMDKNLLWVEIIGSEVVAYCEVWKINYEQWGRISCGELLYTYDENLTDGNIAYISNLWVKECYRNMGLIKIMQDKFTEKFNDCKYVACKRKHGLPYRVYPMKKLGAIHG